MTKTIPDDLYQILLDAGCDKQTISDCLSCIESKEMLLLLQEHRKSLLETIHVCQKQIDCLDFLVYKLKKNEL